jgi:hypothetical protein
MAQRLSMAELLKLKRMASGKPKAGGGGGEAGAVEVVQGATLYDRIDKLAFQNAMCLPADPTLPAAAAPPALLAASGPASARPPRRIAVCLVIVDCLFHEAVWRRWVEGCADTVTGTDTDTDTYTAELYIHAKHPERIQSPWVRARTLPGTFLPEWNSIEVHLYPCLPLYIFLSIPLSPTRRTVSLLTSACV